MAACSLIWLYYKLVRRSEVEARNYINLVRIAEKETPSLEEGLNTIREILDSAENQRFDDEHMISNWLSRLEQTSYKIEDVLEERNYTVLKHQIEKHGSDGANVAPPRQEVSSFIPSSSFLGLKKVVARRDFAKKILDAKAHLDESLVEIGRYGFLISQPTIDPMPENVRVEPPPMVDLARVRGRDKDRDILVNKLVNNSCNPEELSIPIISIVGMGGLGKTALAQLIFDDIRVKKTFELRIRVYVSYRFDLTAIAKKILTTIEGKTPDTDHLSVLLKHVKEHISGKKFLLVLDDVWSEDCSKWEPLANSLRCGGVGSKILVTTRNERVLKIMGSRDSEIFRLGMLSDEDCRLLLCYRSLSGRNNVEVEEIVKKIAKRCSGLPLVAIALERLLHFNNSLELWRDEIRQMESVKIEIFSPFRFSYNELSPTLKLCFSYFAVFPKDAKIDVESLIGNWMALGYLDSGVGDMELKGRECFDILSMHSLLQVFEEEDCVKMQYCKMHYIVHDFTMSLRKSGRVETIGMNKSSTCQTCNLLQVSTVNEYRTLYCDKETPPNLCACLGRTRVLSLVNCGLQSIPKGMEHLNRLRFLKLIGIAKISQEDFKIIFQLYDLQTLSLSKCGLEEIPREIENLIRLRHLDLSWNESLKELPREIENLLQLSHLNLSWNESLQELPSKIGNLICLRHLILNQNKSLRELPESICHLHKLQTLSVLGCKNLFRLPEGVAQLTGLQLLNEFRGGSHCSKFGYLKNLNLLGGVLWLRIKLDGDCDLAEVVLDAREAELKNKTNIEKLRIYFEESSSSPSSSSSSSVRDLMDALQPHPKLRELSIWKYRGSVLPKWMLSAPNQVRKLNLHFCNHLTSLPTLGNLPCLEEICIDLFEALEIVGREFLGLTREGGAGDVVFFPTLKMLELRDCDKWENWEDINVEEEESTTTSVMPCLTTLTITGCNGLTMLPHRLLRKASSLETLRISGSTQLLQRYDNKDGPDWKSISTDNPRLQLICYP